MSDFRQLKVWEEAHRLALDIHHATRTFPREELYGLTSQIRRAALSVPANIAEGCGRGGDVEFGRFIRIAQGSASELAYHLIFARDLGYLDAPSYQALDDHLARVRKMLFTLHHRLRPSSTPAVPDVDRRVSKRPLPASQPIKDE